MSSPTSRIAVIAHQGSVAQAPRCSGITSAQSFPVSANASGWETASSERNMNPSSFVSSGVA
jgi:hypothetical protein